MKVVQRIEASEFTSPLWRKLVDTLEERIELHRTSLESPDLTEVETAHLRARIAEDRHLLALPRFHTAALDIEVPPDTNYY